MREYLFRIWLTTGTTVELRTDPRQGALVIQLLSDIIADVDILVNGRWRPLMPALVAV